MIVLLQKRIDRVSCSANYQNNISLLDKKVFNFNPFFFFHKRTKAKIWKLYKLRITSLSLKSSGI